MEHFVRCAFTQIVPATDDVAGWAQAIAAQALTPSTGIDIDCQNGRLPAGLFAGLKQAALDLKMRGGGIRLLNASPTVQAALGVFQVGNAVTVIGHQATGTAQLPGTLSYAGSGHIAIVIDKQANQDNMNIIPNQQWMQGIACVLVSIDLHEINHVSSIMIAWLLQLANAAKPAATELRGITRQVDIQLSQLRIGQLMSIKQG